MSDSREQLKKATAFAYGWTKAKLKVEDLDFRRESLQNLRDDMLNLGVMLPNGTVKPPYHVDMLAGKTKAEAEEALRGES